MWEKQRLIVIGVGAAGTHTQLRTHAHPCCPAQACSNPPQQTRQSASLPAAYVLGKSGTAGCVSMYTARRVTTAGHCTHVQSSSTLLAEPRGGTLLLA